MDKPLSLGEKDVWSDAIIESIDMKTGEAFLLKRLAKFANSNNDNIAYPSKQTLMKMLKVSNVKTLNVWLKTLEDIGLIIVRGRFPKIGYRGRGQPAHIWQVNFDFDLEAYKEKITNLNKVQNLPLNGFNKDQNLPLNTDNKVQNLLDYNPIFTTYAYIDIYIRDILADKSKILEIPSPLSPDQTEGSKSQYFNLFLFCLKNFKYKDKYLLKHLLEKKNFIKKMEDKICNGEVGKGFPINHLTYGLDTGTTERLKWATKWGYNPVPVRDIENWLPSVIDQSFEREYIAEQIGFDNKEWKVKKLNMMGEHDPDDIFHIQPTKKRHEEEKRKKELVPNTYQ